MPPPVKVAFTHVQARTDPPAGVAARSQAVNVDATSKERLATTARRRIPRGSPDCTQAIAGPDGSPAMAARSPTEGSGLLIRSGGAAGLPPLSK
jgi:hypothetical protein